VGVAVDGDQVLIADSASHAIRSIENGMISTVAGTGQPGFSGEGQRATLARLDGPSGIAVMPDGGFLIADTNNSRVRRVLRDGTIWTVAGDGRARYAGDGGPAVRGSLTHPKDVAVTTDGGFLIADTGNNAIRKVSLTGLISTVVGTGASVDAGDGGP